MSSKLMRLAAWWLDWTGTSGQR